MLLKSPKTCLLTVTNSCVLRCKMCHLWRLDTAAEEISITDSKKLIDSLGKFGSEPMDVHIIGGESLLKRGVLDLVRHISDKGWRTIITSCGYTIDKDQAKAIVDSGLSMLNISLDSLNPKVHNFLRGRDDAYERLMRAIEYINQFRGQRMKLGINTVISSSNLLDITDLAEWVMQNKQLDSIYFMAVMRPFGSSLGWDWFKTELGDELWPKDYPKTVAVLDKLIELKKHSHKIENPVAQIEAFKMYFRSPQEFIKAKRCNVAEQAININALGDAYICFFMDKLGSIKDHNRLAELWYSDRAEEIRSKMRLCRNNCELVVNCYYEEA